MIKIVINFSFFKLDFFKPTIDNNKTCGSKNSNNFSLHHAISNTFLSPKSVTYYVDVLKRIIKNSTFGISDPPVHQVQYCCLFKIVKSLRSCGFESRLKFNCQCVNFFQFFFKFFFSPRSPLGADFHKLPKKKNSNLLKPNHCRPTKQPK